MDGAATMLADHRRPDPEGDTRMDPQDLVGHTWEVVEIDGEPVSLQQPPAVEFTPDGRIVGNTGANRLMGGYEVADDRMRVTQLATTMMSGRPDAMRTETRLVQALGAGGDVEMHLVLRNSHSGNSVRLRRIANTRPAATAPAEGAAASDGDRAEQATPADAPTDPPEPPPAEERPATAVSDGAPVVRGSVVYRERTAMPEGSVVIVHLLDTSRSGSPAEVIGEQVIEGAENVPVAFEIGYEPSIIDATHSYAVAARIEVNGQLTWRSTIHHPVLTRGAGHSAVVMVTRAG
jgi:putative lipoprotein